jgi:hypothetical protein
VILAAAISVIELSLNPEDLEAHKRLHHQIENLGNKKKVTLAATISVMELNLKRRISKSTKSCSARYWRRR